MFAVRSGRLLSLVESALKQNAHNKIWIQSARSTALFSTKTIPKEDKAGTLRQVYYGILTPQIKAVKFFSFSSSLVGIIGQPFLYKSVVATGSVPIIIAAYSFIGFFTLVTPLLLHFITKKYVTHLLYNPATGNYIAKTVSFFCTTKQTEFNVDQVRVPDVPGMFTTFFAKDKALFVDPRLFENPNHFAKIMGYDKPIDYKLADPPTETKT